MTTKPRQRYTAEFKAQAVELISTGKPNPQIALQIDLEGYKGITDLIGGVFFPTLTQAINPSNPISRSRRFFYPRRHR